MTMKLASSPSHEFLDHHAVARVARLLPASMPSTGLMRFGIRRRDDHTLARGEPIGLDHDRRTVSIDVGVRGGRVRESLVAPGGIAWRCMKRLAKSLKPRVARPRASARRS